MNWIWSYPASKSFLLPLRSVSADKNTSRARLMESRGQGRPLQEETRLLSRAKPATVTQNHTSLLSLVHAPSHLKQGKRFFSPLKNSPFWSEHVTFNSRLTSPSYTHTHTHTHTKINMWMEKWMDRNGRKRSITTFHSYISTLCTYYNWFNCSSINEHLGCF